MCANLDIHLRPDVNQSRWLQVSRRASHQLWRPELSLAGLVGVTRLELAQVSCDWSAAASRALIGQEAGQLRVRGDKTVNTVTRLGVSVMCSMDLALYPHDTQVGPGSSRIEWFLELQPSRAFS